MHVVDAVIVGGGLSGSLAAVLLGRVGFNVALVDRYSEYPPEFRAEQLVGSQVDTLRRLGVFETLASGATHVDHAIAARHGKIIERVYAPHYGLSYEAMVKAARAQLPASVGLIVDQVVDIETSPVRPRVRLASGRILECRIVVLATGPANGLLRKLGIRRRTLRDDHSLAIGFDVVVPPGNPLERSVLVYYGENLRDRMDYISVFPLGTTLRANLFAYRDARQSWVREFHHRPREMLLQVMPGIQRLLGDFHVGDKVQLRANRLTAADGYLRDGLALIGDAFQTSCPAAGTGIGRLLTDVGRLCNHHLPRWLRSGDASSARIAEFYADPVKRAADAEALQLADYRRAISTDTSLSWRLHQLCVYTGRSVRGRVTFLRRNRPETPSPRAPAVDPLPISV